MCSNLLPLGQVIQTTIREASVDLLGVVVDVTVSKAPFPIHVLWLRDDSLTSKTILAVSIKIQQQQQVIVVGDVVRMNSVKLVSSEEYAAAGTRIFHFTLNAFDPASTYAVLGRIREDGFQEYTTIMKHAAFADPGSMATHPSCIERLVEWYSRRQQRQDQPAALSALSPLRRFQTLPELQSSRGIVSHACARVLDVQTHVSHSPRSRKQQQQRLIGGKTQTYALLKDVNDETTLTFVDSLNKWTPLLQTAQSTCQAVQMFHVKTGLCENDVVLLPTLDTRIVLMDEDSIVNHSKSTETEQLDVAQSQFMLSLTQQQHHEDYLQPKQMTILASIHSLQVQFNENEQLQVSETTNHRDFDIFVTRLVDCLHGSRHENINGPSGRMTLCEHSQYDHTSKIMVDFSPNGIMLPRLLGGCTLSDGSLGKLNAATASALLKALIYHQVQLQWTLEQICVARDSENNGCEYAAINVEHVGGL